MPSSPSVPIIGPELVNRNESGDVLTISLDGLMESIVSQLVRKKIERNIVVKIFFFILFSNILTNNID